MEKNQREVKFKVSMDKEHREAKNTKEVKFIVDFSETSQDVLMALAIGAQNIRWQAQIKSHWTEFLEGKLPKLVKFGEPLFGSGTRTRVVKAEVTEDDVKKYLDKLTPAQKLQRTIEMMEEAGMEISDDLMRKLDELTDAEEMEAVAARLKEEEV